MKAAVLALVLALASPAAAKPLEIVARPITHFAIGSTETRFGGLEFAGGLELTSPDRDLGALSAFRFLTPGDRFIGVADTGFWFTGRVVRDGAGHPSGFADFAMEEMVDATGAAIGAKWLTDAEGLAVGDGIVTVSFERAHRVSEYQLTPDRMGAPLRDLPFLVPGRELRDNRGFEGVAMAPSDGPLAGARVLVTEKSLDAGGDIFAAVIDGPRKGVFTIARRDGFDISDGAFLPGGDLLLLERSFAMAEGVKMRLRRIPGASIAKGARVDGPVLLTADMGDQIDNMEGLDVWTRSDGATMLSLVSDDNHSIFQRNLYLEFRLVE